MDKNATIDHALGKNKHSGSSVLGANLTASVVIKRHESTFLQDAAAFIILFQ
jgi:hypothetical protein